MKGTITVSIDHTASKVTVRASVDNTPIYVAVDMTDPDAIDSMADTFREYAKRVRHTRMCTGRDTN